jgi:hypothetical protein
MCKEMKPVTEFFKRKESSDGLDCKCKNCRSKCRKLLNNPVDTNIKEKTCTKCKNTKSVAEFTKNKRSVDGWKHTCKVCERRYHNNQEYRDKVNKRRVERYKEDEGYRLKACLSGGLYRALKGVGLSKNNISIIKYFDCTKEEIFERLNSTKDQKWTDEDLHIDHIIPVSLFDHTDDNEIKKCWNLRNIRYLPALENLSKGDKLDMELIKKYGIEDLLPKI